MDFFDFIYAHQWIAYAPGLVLLGWALFRALFGGWDNEDAQRRQDDTEPRLMVVERVPSAFETFKRNDQKSGK